MFNLIGYHVNHSTTRVLLDFNVLYHRNKSVFLVFKASGESHLFVIFEYMYFFVTTIRKSGFSIDIMRLK
jgi:hypothetical protein